MGESDQKTWFISPADGFKLTEARGVCPPQKASAGKEASRRAASPGLEV